jgi:hypothetical protein
MSAVAAEEDEEGYQDQPYDFVIEDVAETIH